MAKAPGSDRRGRTGQKYLKFVQEIRVSAEGGAIGALLCVRSRRRRGQTHRSAPTSALEFLPAAATISDKYQLTNSFLVSDTGASTPNPPVEIFVSAISYGQQDFSRGLSPGKLSVRFRRLGQRKNFFDSQFQLSCGYPSKDISGSLSELRGSGRIIGQTRPSQKERSSGRQNGRIERGDRAAGLTE